MGWEGYISNIQEICLSAVKGSYHNLLWLWPAADHQHKSGAAITILTSCQLIRNAAYESVTVKISSHQSEIFFPPENSLSTQALFLGNVQNIRLGCDVSSKQRVCLCVCMYLDQQLLSSHEGPRHLPNRETCVTRWRQGGDSLRSSHWSDTSHTTDGSICFLFFTPNVC